LLNLDTFIDSCNVVGISLSNRFDLKALKPFLLIWLGQSISLTGSSLTGFALGVWVYQSTGSVTQFALIALFTALPGILFSPIAGALVDRWDRRQAMILSDCGAGLCTLSMAILLILGRLEVWHIYLGMALSSTFSAFQWPAYSAATTLLVPKEHYGRAAGMVQIGEAFAQIIAPVLAGALMGLIQVQGVMLVDFATLVFAVSTLLLVRVPRPPASREGKEGKGSLLQEAAYGWTYIRARSGLLGLLLFFAASNFASGIVEVLFTPLVLSFTTVEVLGLLFSIGGVGFLVGSITMSVWGGPKRRVVGILGSNVVVGLVLFLAGIPPRTWTLGIAVFLVFFCMPITNSCSQAIWQSKTPPDVQGRVFAVRRMIAWIALPLSYVSAGPLADHVFEPLMAEGGGLAGSLGRIIGVGDGRGVGLIYIILGILLLLVSFIAYLYPRLRNVELELPDFVEEQAAEVHD
jgi:DHA3 family macrolide efflux protein-like MFS transporter